MLALMCSIVTYQGLLSQRSLPPLCVGVVSTPGELQLGLSPSNQMMFAAKSCLIGLYTRLGNKAEET